MRRTNLVRRVHLGYDGSQITCGYLGAAQMRGDSRLTQMRAGLVQALYVPTCAWCDRRGSWVCQTCLPTVDLISAPGCPRCGVVDPVGCECALLPPEIQRLRSIYPFDRWVRSAIHRFKFDGERARAESLSEHFDRLPDLFQDAHAIVAVPMHRNRLRARGFNQAALLAAHVAKRHNIPLIAPLVRIEDRGSQVGRSLPDRWLAVDGVFECVDPAAVRSRRIVILDDVITTGATVSSCATTLAQAGAANVCGVSLSRG